MRGAGVEARCLSLPQSSSVAPRSAFSRSSRTTSSSPRGAFSLQLSIWTLSFDDPLRLTSRSLLFRSDSRYFYTNQAFLAKHFTYKRMTNVDSCVARRTIRRTTGCPDFTPNPRQLFPTLCQTTDLRRPTPSSHLPENTPSPPCAATSRS